MGRLPTWVSNLPERRFCGMRPVEWHDWNAQVPAFCASFESTPPRRTRLEIKERWADEYGKPPLVGITPAGFTLGEIALVEAFRRAFWTAYWTDTFGAAPDWTIPWRRPVGPEQERADKIAALIERIRLAATQADL